MIEGYTQGRERKRVESIYPLEKEALDYFINNAGSPNGVIDGGLAILHPVTNMNAGIPAAYSKCIAVSAVGPILPRLLILTTVWKRQFCSVVIRSTIIR